MKKYVKPDAKLIFIITKNDILNDSANFNELYDNIVISPF